MAPLVTDLSKAIDNKSIETIQKDYSEIANGLRKVAKIKPKPIKKPEPKPEPEKKAPEPPKQETGDCPNGNCPQQQTNGRMFYWGR